MRYLIATLILASSLCAQGTVTRISDFQITPATPPLVTPPMVVGTTYTLSYDFAFIFQNDGPPTSCVGTAYLRDNGSDLPITPVNSMYSAQVTYLGFDLWMFHGSVGYTYTPMPAQSPSMLEVRQNFHYRDAYGMQQWLYEFTHAYVQ